MNFVICFVIDELVPVTIMLIPLNKHFIRSKYLFRILEEGLHINSLSNLQVISSVWILN